MMEWHDQDDIDDFFRDALRFGGRTPPASLWDNIETGLEKENARRVMLGWLQRAVMIVFFLGLSAGWIHRTGYRVSPFRSSKNDAVVAGRQQQAIVGNAKQGSDRGIGPRAAGMAAIAQPLPVNILAKSPGGLSTNQPFQSSPEIVSRLDSPDKRSRYITDLPSLPPFIAGEEANVVAQRILERRYQTVRPRPGDHLHYRNPLDITAFLSQELSGYSLADHDSAGPHGQEIERHQNTSFSKSAGLLVGYRVRRHWMFQSGLSFSQSISIGNPTDVVAVENNMGKVSYQINTITGYGFLAPSVATSVGDTVMTGKITSRLDYVSLPVILSRTWNPGRFTILAGAGFDVNYLTRATVQTSLAGFWGADQQKVVVQYGLRKFNVGLQVKGECRYQFSHRYAAAIMGIFKNSVGPVNNHTSYSTYPYNVGVALGISRIF